jgi:SAM-dependent methyltransferase
MLAPVAMAEAQNGCPASVLTAGGPPPRGAVSDDVLWADFARWSRGLPRLKGDESVDIGRCFVRRLRTAGVDSGDASRRFQRVLDLRSRTIERERLYWDTRFRLGGGPRDPLPLLVDAVAAMRPGTALDAGMGLGRNALYLASRGWTVTGYDFSREAIAGAQAAARQRRVTLTAEVSTHEAFDHGAARWDLIVLSYSAIGPLDAAWPSKLATALKPGGLLVYQGSARLGTTSAEVRRHWAPLAMLRLDVLPAGEDWLAGGDQPTVKFVAQKPRGAAR